MKYSWTWIGSLTDACNANATRVGKQARLEMNVVEDSLVQDGHCYRRAGKRTILLLNRL
jgi:hypothetical protein